MSIYTDARSEPGAKGAAGADDRELFLRYFGGITLEAWAETFDFDGMTMVRNIDAGKSATFPIIGRKRDAAEHVPGELIVGGKVVHDEVEITLDGILTDSAFIADIDEYIAHYELAAPYARQIGESLASACNKRIGATAVSASRVTTEPYPGGPVPSYYFDAAIATDASKLEEAAFKGIEYLRENDIGGGVAKYMLPWQQQLLLARYTGIDTEDTSGSGNRAAGTVGPIAGMQVMGTNSLPNTNITTDSRAKYNGDFTPTVGLILSSLAVGTLRRKGMTVNILDQKDRFGTLMIGSKLEGHGILRPECSFEVANAARV